MFPVFISCVNYNEENMCNHWLMNTNVPSLMYGGSGCKVWRFSYPLFTAAQLQMKLPFIQVVRYYLTCTLGIVEVAMATFDWRERSSLFLGVASSMKRIWLSSFKLHLVPCMLKIMTFCKFSVLVSLSCILKQKCY